MLLALAHYGLIWPQSAGRWVFFPNFRREIDGESYAKGSIVGMEVCATELRTESERLVWVAAIPIKVVVEK